MSDGHTVPLPGFVETTPVVPVRRPSGRTRTPHDGLEGGRRRRRGGWCSCPVSPESARPGLVTELVRTAHDQGALLLWGRVREELDVPYQPFAEALRHYVHSVPADQLRTSSGHSGASWPRSSPTSTTWCQGSPSR